MTEYISFDDLSLGNIAKIQRICRRQTQQEIADIYSVVASNISYIINKKTWKHI